MASHLYSLPTDNKAATVTPTVATGTANASYPVTYINDGITAKPFITTSTGDLRVTWDFGAAQRIDLFAILMHNIPAATAVKFQGHTANTWTSPTVDAAVTIPTYGEDGFPFGAWVDLTAVTGYDVGGFRYWSLFVPNPSQVTKIGEVWLSARKRSFTRNFLHSLLRASERRTIAHETDSGVPLIYDVGTTLRGVAGSIRANSAAFAELLTLWRACKGVVHPFLFILDPAVNDALQVRFVSPFAASTVFSNYDTLDVELREDSRGLTL